MVTTLSYAGIGMQIVQTLDFQHQPVYDALNTYLYTRITISVSAVYNPQATSYANQSVTIVPSLRPTGATRPTDTVGAGGLGLGARTFGPSLPTLPQPSTEALVAGGVGAGEAAIRQDQFSIHEQEDLRRRQLAAEQSRLDRQQQLAVQRAGTRTFDLGPRPSVGVPPAITETAVRHSLSQARQQLIYAVDGVIMVRSPGAGFTVDSANGPVVLEAPTVTQVSGSKSFLVRLTVQTCINECPAGSDKTAPKGIVLSNVWEQSEDLDQDYYQTRTTRGRMTFDTAKLTNAAFSIAPADSVAAVVVGGGIAGAVGARTIRAIADDFRSLTYQPVPAGFKRMNVVVVVVEDGNQLEYSYVDKQQTLSITSSYASSISRIEAIHTSGTGLPDAIGGIAGATGGIDSLRRLGARVGGWVGGGLPVNLSDALGDVLNANAGGIAYFPFQHRIVSSVGSMLPGPLGKVVAALVPPPPVTTHTIVVRVWGNHGSSIDDLSNAAYWVVTYRLSQTFAAAYTINCRESRDVMGNFVEVHIDYSGPGVTWNFGGQVIGHRYPRLRDFFLLSRGHYQIPILAQPQPPTPPLEFQVPPSGAASPPPLQVPYAPSAVDTPTLLAFRNAAGMKPINTTRGTYLGKIVAQILQAPCAAPAQLTVIPGAPGPITINRRGAFSQ